jgi:predicted ferric reductase
MPLKTVSGDGGRTAHPVVVHLDPQTDVQRDRNPEVRLHVIRSRQDGRLTVAEALERADADTDELSVFMCGPQGMVTGLQPGFRDAGVQQRRIFREYFDWR